MKVERTCDMAGLSPSPFLAYNSLICVAIVGHTEELRRESVTFGKQMGDVFDPTAARSAYDEFRPWLSKTLVRLCQVVQDQINTIDRSMWSAVAVQSRTCDLRILSDVLNLPIHCAVQRKPGTDNLIQNAKSVRQLPIFSCEFAWLMFSEHKRNAHIWVPSIPNADNIIWQATIDVSQPMFDSVTIRIYTAYGLCDQP